MARVDPPLLRLGTKGSRMVSSRLSASVSLETKGRSERQCHSRTHCLTLCRIAVDSAAHAAQGPIRAFHSRYDGARCRPALGQETPLSYRSAARTILTFRHLEAIRAVMTTGSVTGAAERLHVTQPAISHLLRDAEGRLGYSLFSRHLGRLAPTERAQLIFEQIERSFSGLEQVNEYCAHLRDSTQRQLVIASIPTVAAAILPSVISRSQMAGRRPLFQIKAANTEAGITSVRFATADLAFGVNLDPVPGVESADICTSHALCFLPPGHRLAARDVIDPKDLIGEPTITLSRMEGIAQRIEAHFEGGDRPGVTIVEAPSAITAAALVEAGVGYTLLDPIAASIFGSSQIVFRRFAKPISFVHRAYWSSSAGRDRQRDRLIELAQEVARTRVADFLAKVLGGGRGDPSGSARGLAAGEASPQQDVDEQDRDGDGDQEGAHGRDGRLDLQAQAIPDPNRQRLGTDARQEQRNDEFVEGGEEAEQRRGQQAREN